MIAMDEDEYGRALFPGQGFYDFYQDKSISDINHNFLHTLFKRSVTLDTIRLEPNTQLLDLLSQFCEACNAPYDLAEAAIPRFLDNMSDLTKLSEGIFIVVTNYGCVAEDPCRLIGKPIHYTSISIRHWIKSGKTFYIGFIPHECPEIEDYFSRLRYASEEFFDYRG